MRPSPRILFAALRLAILVVGAATVWSRIAQVQQGVVLPEVPQGVTRDPATRARGAVLTISGAESRPRVTYDPASGTVQAALQSKYYDPDHTAALNRQYLATEGRLVVQLVFHNVPEVTRVVVELYGGRQKLATVTGGQGDTYEGYMVEYARGLP